MTFTILIQSFSQRAALNVDGSIYLTKKQADFAKVLADRAGIPLTATTEHGYIAALPGNNGYIFRNITAYTNE